MVQCPECGEEYSPQGLHGHLRMAHGLSGAELQQTYENSLKGDLFDGEKPESETGERREKAPPEAAASEVAEEGDEEPESPRRTFHPSGAERQDEQEADPERSTSEQPTGEPEPEQRGPARRERGGDRFEDRSPVARAAERLRRAVQRRRVVEEEMDTEEREVEGSGPGLFASGKTEEVPANATWSDLLEMCCEEEEEARKDLKRAVYHADGPSE